jgi:tRNA pseudouridine55 synthase
LARKGEKIDMPTRKVKISNFEIKDYNYPYLSLKADVSSGTYIRSLARVIGEQLKVGAYCTQIVRTRIGEFELSKANVLD